MTPLSVPNRLAAGGAGYRVRMHGTPGLALLGACAALLVVITGCTVGSLEPPADQTAAGSSPSPDASDGGTSDRSRGSGGGSVDLSNLPIARGEFCDLLDPDAVEEALSGPVLETAHYVNGQDASLAPGVTDVAHEYGCVFEGSSPAVARAWVFARPVQRAEARRLARGAKAAPRCREADSIGFGDPGVATICRPDRSSPVVQVRLAGLFTDSWFSCELSLPGGPQRAGEVRRTAERWCMDVAVTLGARP